MSMIKKFGILLAAAALVIMMVAGCSNKAATTTTEQKVLKIGAIPDESEQKMRDGYKPLLDYLEKKTGMKTELFVATDYTGVIEAMHSKKIDLAYFGPLSYVLAADQAGAEAFCVENRKETGTSYHAVIVVNPASGIKSLQDLKGHTFAFVDPASTSGNLIPRAVFKKNNIDPDKDFKSTIYAGGHDAVELAVKNKKVDAGADDDITYNNMTSKGLITKNDSVVIFTSDPIPGSPWAYRKDLPDDMKSKIKDAFLGVAKEDPQALQTYAGSVLSYEPANDGTYSYVRDLSKLLNTGKQS